MMVVTFTPESCQNYSEVFAALVCGQLANFWHRVAPAGASPSSPTSAQAKLGEFLSMLAATTLLLERVAVIMYATRWVAVASREVSV